MVGPAEADAVARRDTQNLLRAKCILIVDDDSVVRRIVRRELEDSGWVCEEAGNGVDGISKARVLHPDLIILDLAMPLMNGYDAAVTLHQEMPNIPLVMLTMHGDVLGKPWANPSGVKAIIAKTEDVTVLVKCVRQLLGC